MSERLRQAVVLFKQGNREEARRLAASELRADPHNPQAWALMSRLVEDPRQVADCLRQVIKLSDDPKLREAAQKRLSELEQKTAPTLPSAHKTPPLRRSSTWLLPMLAVIVVVLLVLVGGVALLVRNQLASTAQQTMPSASTATAPATASTPHESGAASQPAPTIMTGQPPLPAAASTLLVTPTVAVSDLPPIIVEEQRITLVEAGLEVIEGMQQDFGFGTSIAVSDDTLLVGAPYTFTNSADDNTGSVQVFTRSRDASGSLGPWMLETALVPPGYDWSTYDEWRFGSAVAVEGNVVAVGAPGQDTLGHNSGAVHIYERQGELWVEVDVITSPDGSTRYGFGGSILLRDGVLYIGAPGGRGYDDVVYPGVVFVMHRGPDGWEQAQRLEVASDMVNFFGSSLDLKGDTLVVGAPGIPDIVKNEGYGAVYLFRHQGDQWVQQAEIRAPVSSGPRRFGSDVSLENGRLAVSAPSVHNDAAATWNDEGQVWVFEDISPDGTWASYNQVELAPPPLAHEAWRHYYGTSILLKGNVLLVGARRNEDSGSVLVYAYEGSEWIEKTRLTGLERYIRTGMGVSLVAQNDEVFVGAPGNEYDDPESVYIFRLPLLASPGVDISGGDVSLDAAFADGGILRIPMHEFRNVWPTEVEVQPDGKILIAGSRNNPHQPDIVFLTRLNPDGSFDQSFNQGQIIEEMLTINPEVVRTIIQPDGKILVVLNGEFPERGGSEDHSEILIVRYNADGSRDETFGTGGYKSLVFGPDYNGVFDATLQQGKQLILLSHNALVRLNEDGSLDASFGKDGISTITRSLANDLRSLTSQPDGRLLVVGQQYRPGIYGESDPGFHGETDSLLLRLNPEGSLDTTFGTQGVALLPGVAYGFRGAIFSLADGATLFVTDDTNDHFIVARFTQEGLLDPAFGNNGLVSHALSDSSYLTTVALASNGKILIGGSIGGRLGLIRLNSDGSLDTSFAGGYILLTFHPQIFLYDIAMLLDGRIATLSGVGNEFEDVLKLEVWLAVYQGGQ